METTKEPEAKKSQVTIKAPNFQTIAIKINGTAALMVNKFSAKCQEKIRATQEAGDKSKSRRLREAKDFGALYESARHKSGEGWDGIHAGAFRNAMISACRAAGYAMTRAKLAVFVLADGADAEDGTPLVKIVGKPSMDVRAARNDSGGVDLRPRPIYKTWSATVRVRFDADMLDEKDVLNLMMRVGLQVGIGEGRPDSRESNGMGLGLFDVVGVSTMRQSEAA